MTATSRNTNMALQRHVPQDLNAVHAPPFIPFLNRQFTTTSPVQPLRLERSACSQSSLLSYHLRSTISSFLTSMLSVIQNLMHFKFHNTFFSNGSTAPWGPNPPHFSRLHDHTL
jgi:hypothetical protein